MRICIVGSGPSGLISANYLKNYKNLKIDILDVGIANNLNFSFKTNNFIPIKTVFNNAFMYKRADELKINFDKLTDFYTSHALGGLK